MNPFLRTIYDPDIKEICASLLIINDVFICSCDQFILKFILEDICKIFFKQGYEIYKTDKKLAINSKSLVLINVDLSASLSTNSVFYYYLEKNCKLIFYSNRVMSLENMEKRVRSRLSDYTFFINPLSLSQCTDFYYYLILKTKTNNKKIAKIVLDKKFELGEDQKKFVLESTLNELNLQFQKSCSVQGIINFYLKVKYKIEEYNLETCLGLLNPIHISILIICIHKRVFYYNVVQEFRKSNISCKELKKTRRNDILDSYSDILEFGIINEKGALLIDLNEFKDFVHTKCPVYMRNLMMFT